VTLGSSASSVTFSSIPATYRDLILVVNGQPVTNSAAALRLNADTGSNYSAVYMRANSITNSVALTDTVFYYCYNFLLNGSRFVSTVQIMDYSATDKHKTMISRSSYTASSGPFTTSEAGAAQWASTSAVTSINIVSGDYATGTTFSLYGVIA